MNIKKLITTFIFLLSVPAVYAQSGGSSLRVELESLTGQGSFSPFNVEFDASASGGQYIAWPNNGNQILNSPSDGATGQVEILFALSQTANVQFQVRANMPNANDDSFYYKLDAGAWNTQNNTATSGWSMLTPATFNNLPAGDHTLRILRREDGAGLDHVTLTASAGEIAGGGGGGGNTIVVRALGTTGTESITLRVGDTDVQSWTLSTSMMDYAATSSLNGDVTVAFTNDSGGDADVQIDYVQVNGQTRQAEDQSENTGAWGNNQCGGGSNTEWLHCNGHINFGPVSGSGQVCDLPGSLSWSSSQPLITPKNGKVSVKDPTIIHYNGLYHVFATVYDSAYRSIYLNFTDFNQAAAADQLNFAPGGSSTVAPQVFYFAPQNRWYLITQWPGKYSTNTDITNPNGWTSPQTLLAGEPNGSLDFWVICDDANCYLFFSRDDGGLYMSKTTIGNFPNFSGYTTVMSGAQNVLFEAANVYKLQGLNKYLLMVEGWQSGPRLFRAWTSNSLDGPWTAYKTSESDPFAGSNNVSFPGGRWTNDISHGEMIRVGYDQKMEIDACNMQYLYQGVDPNSTNVDYNLLPWNLGLLTAN